LAYQSLVFGEEDRNTRIDLANCQRDKHYANGGKIKRHEYDLIIVGVSRMREVNGDSGRWSWQLERSDLGALPQTPLWQVSLVSERR
jgi:hypothetical protein